MNEIFIDLNSTSILCEIMGRNGSDKSDKHNIVEFSFPKHNYTLVYHELFKNFRFEKLRIFELGLGTNNEYVVSNMGRNGIPGASLRGWAEYFPNSLIFGADIDSNILFQTDRIKTFYCDQTNPHVIRYMWNEESLKENFDIIIEDGLHEFGANVCFFENSIHKLKSKGYYIIEDLNIHIKHIYTNQIDEWRLKYPDCIFSLLDIKSFENHINNMILVVYKN